MAGSLGLKELSMGMSDDFEVAVEEGATTLRLGRALFGPGPEPQAATIGLSYGRHQMASGIMRRAMVYLGLTDDEFEDYDYEERRPGPAPPATVAIRRLATRRGGVSAVRPVRRERGEPTNGVA